MGTYIHTYILVHTYYSIYLYFIYIHTYVHSYIHVETYDRRQRSLGDLSECASRTQDSDMQQTTVLTNSTPVVRGHDVKRHDELDIIPNNDGRRCSRQASRESYTQFSCTMPQTHNSTVDERAKGHS